MQDLLIILYGDPGELDCEHNVRQSNQADACWLSFKSPANKAFTGHAGVMMCTLSSEKTERVFTYLMC